MKKNKIKKQKNPNIGKYKKFVPPEKNPLHKQLKRENPATDTLQNKKAKTTRNFIRGDTNKQLNNSLLYKENKNPTTWIADENGKLVSVNIKDLNKKKQKKNFKKSFRKK